MKKYLTTLLLFFNISLFSQEACIITVPIKVHDTTIINKAYTTIYSFNLKAPLVVYYKLYKGGGKCNRTKYFFKSEHVRTAKDSDYEGSGFDKGHLANSEDFAFDCEKDELTFRYWNCYPQTPELNRGIWKQMETKARNMSNMDSVIILCGGIYSNKKIGNGVYIPDTCWKVVYNISMNHYVICCLFTNTNKPVSTSLDIKILNAILIKKYNIDVVGIIKKMTTYK